MSCYAPLEAFRKPDGSITFQRDRSVTRIGFKLPCGQCIGCRLEKSRQWAMRCIHEAKMSTESSFVTLTYDNKFLPPGGSLSKSAFQLFMKRLRKEKGDGIRFYACGEYGDLNKRPHYHALLFNCGFSDRKKIGQNTRGEYLYSSAVLERLWGFGFCSIGDVTFDSAAYVARYLLKKVTGELAPDHYMVVDGDGVIYDRIPEFALMSRRPGIGSAYYDKFGHELRAHDNVIVNGMEVKPPRFYDTRTECRFPDVYADLKKARKRAEVLNRSDNTPARLRVKEVIAERRVSMKKREL